MDHLPSGPLVTACLNDLSFLIGEWSGKVGDDLVTERWFPAQADQMVGIVTWLREGRIHLHEFMVLGTWPGYPQMRFRHLRPDCSSIEAASTWLEMDLVAVGGGRAMLLESDGIGPYLTYERAGDHLKIWFDPRPGGTCFPGVFELELHR